MRNEPPWLFQYLDLESPKDEYWAGQDVTIDEIRDISVPHFAVGGFRDTYAHPVTKYVQQMGGPTRLVLGPWRHSVPNDGREAAVDFYTQMLEWFDRFLKDEENGALNRPRVEYWTERNGGGKIGEGLWRGSDRWPEAGDGEAEPCRFR